MASSIYIGGHYDGTVTENTRLPDVEEYDADAYLPRTRASRITTTTPAPKTAYFDEVQQTFTS